MPRIDDLPDVLTAADVAKLLGFGRGKSYELMRISVEAGGIPSVRIGKNVRVLKSDLIEWLAAQRK